ncbi:hypothetical protein GCM10023068_00010 [Leifsonia shinshuensis]
MTAANAAVAMAQQNVSLGTLTSPIDGVVAAVSLTPGGTVSAGSHTSDITIIGSSGWSVNATVPVTHIGSLKLGQKASVTVAGAAAPLTGSVSAIGVTDVSSDTSNPAYSVTVGLDDAGAHLLNGAPAQATVSVASAADVLAVPTSAIHRLGATTIVDKIVNGAPVVTRVTVGTAGGDFTQITPASRRATSSSSRTSPSRSRARPPGSAAAASAARIRQGHGRRRHGNVGPHHDDEPVGRLTRAQRPTR